MSSYKLLTGDSTDPVSLPPHHSTPPLVKNPAVTEIHMLIWVTGYIPSKSAKPVKALNNVLKHQKPEAHPTEHAATSPPPPHQVTSTSQSSLSRRKSTARPANLDDGESMTGCLPGRKCENQSTISSSKVKDTMICQIYQSRDKTVSLCRPDLLSSI